jgi:hypothetical protein
MQLGKCTAWQADVMYSVPNQKLMLITRADNLSLRPMPGLLGKVLAGSKSQEMQQQGQ